MNTNRRIPFLLILLLPASFSGCYASSVPTSVVPDSFFIREFSPMSSLSPSSHHIFFIDRSGLIQIYDESNDSLSNLRQSNADTRPALSNLALITSTLSNDFVRLSERQQDVSEYYPSHLELFLITTNAVTFAWAGDPTRLDPRIAAVRTAFMTNIVNHSIVTSAAPAAFRADLLDTRTAAEFRQADLIIPVPARNGSPLLSAMLNNPFKLFIPLPVTPNPLSPFRSSWTVGRDTLACSSNSRCFQVRSWHLKQSDNSSVTTGGLP